MRIQYSALIILVEKYAVLHMLLIEYCTNPAYRNVAHNMTTLVSADRNHTVQQQQNTKLSDGVIYHIKL